MQIEDTVARDDDFLMFFITNYLYSTQEKQSKIAMDEFRKSLDYIRNLEKA